MKLTICVGVGVGNGWAMVRAFGGYLVSWGPGGDFMDGVQIAGQTMALPRTNDTED